MKELLFHTIPGMFKVDALSWVMFSLVGFVSLNVGIFP